MSFCQMAWEATAAVRRDIDELPFLASLRDGSLPRESFVYYLAQDALYLVEFGRAMAMAGAQADGPEDLLFWVERARSAILVERQLHATHTAGVDAVTMSPTCTAYTALLRSLGTGGCYPALAAGVLPCFWIYEDVGRRLLQDVGDLAAHPYGDWIGTYGDPEFAAATAQAKAVVDRLAARSGPDVVARMHAAFLTAARYELLFWDAAWRRETWLG
ncbi:MAG: TenA family protein [Actinomycetota bacterium]|nr:TenA family protein [Actinomycetota bacterium]